MATKKQVHWTIKLVTDGPIDQEKIVEALKPLGQPEVTDYRVRAAKE